MRRINPSGFGVALLGFFLTRYTVTFALSGAPVPFIIGNVAPLVLGLSLSAFGVTLAVGAFERRYVRTIAFWTILGTGSIGLLVLVTVYAADQSLIWKGRVAGAFSNILIGGSVGGALTGVYAAQNRAFQRELLNRQNRLVILNRLLHDKVMNAITVIKGTAPMLREESPSGPGSVEAILEKARSVENVMGSVRDLAEPGQDAELKSTDAAEAVETALAQARERHPEATLVAHDLPSGPSVYANHRLADVIYQLVINGAEHSGREEPRVVVQGDVREESVVISVVDEGPGLPSDAREALEKERAIAGTGNATPGLGLYLARLYVRTFGGTIEVETGEEGAKISVVLPRAGKGSSARRLSSGQAQSLGIGLGQLKALAAASVASGIVMGGYMHVTTGAMPVIGALYGTKSALVGFLTHEFHSLVFGLVYGAFLLALPDRLSEGWGGPVGVGVGWGALLWLVAAGVVMPVWLNLVGVPAQVPNLSLHGLVGHVVWGTALGLCYEAGRRWIFRVGSSEPKLPGLWEASPRRWATQH